MKTETIGKYLTVRETAEHYSRIEHLEITTNQILYAIQKKEIPAVKKGWNWLIPMSDLPARWPLRYKRSRE